MNFPFVRVPPDPRAHLSGGAARRLFEVRGFRYEDCAVFIPAFEVERAGSLQDAYCSPALFSAWNTVSTNHRLTGDACIAWYVQTYQHERRLGRLMVLLSHQGVHNFVEREHRGWFEHHGIPYMYKERYT